MAFTASFLHIDLRQLVQAEAGFTASIAAVTVIDPFVNEASGHIQHHLPLGHQCFEHQFDSREFTLVVAFAELVVHHLLLASRRELA